jgi:DMSO/TMAO reductase YedYZ molybdopterin-dependent catalytic subunit
VSSPLPPGQRELVRLPVHHIGDPPLTDSEGWTLAIQGELERPVVLTLAHLRQLSTVEIEADFHAADGWSVRGLQWRGVRLADVLGPAKPLASAKFLRAFDGQKYDASLAFDDALEPDVLLATGLGGAVLPIEHGGPLRLVVPARYGWKSVKWLRGIEITAEERPGFWERRGFHRRGDPWADERLA